MLAQLTNSGSNSNTMAAGIEQMFLQGDESVDWDLFVNQMQCYAPKLVVTVKEVLRPSTLQLVTQN